MWGAGCQYLASVFCNQYHILDIKSVNTVNIAGYLHCQHHASLKGPCLRGIDIGGLSRCRTHTDGMALMSPSLAGEHFLHIVIGRMIQLIHRKAWPGSRNHPALTLIQPIL